MESTRFSVRHLGRAQHFWSCPTIGLIAITAVAPVAAGSGPDQLAWSEVDNSGPTPRYYHAVAFDVDHGELVLFGGNTGETDTWVWNTHTSTWNLAAPEGAGPSRRGGHAMVYDRDRHRVVLSGGWYNGTTYKDVWEWDGATRTWHQGPSLPDARNAHSMAYDTKQQKTILYGGSSLTTTLQYDGASWVSVPTNNNPGAQWMTGMAYDVKRDVTVLVLSGNPFPAIATPTQEYKFDPATQTGNWSPGSVASSSPPERARPVLAYDEANTVSVLYGGLYLQPNHLYAGVGDTWLYNGSIWSQRQTWTQRHLHAMAYDPIHAEILTYGGNAGACACTGFRDIQAWDGSAWSQRTFRNSIEATYLPSMGFDEKRHRTVVFGGLRLNPQNFNNVPPLSNTWEWDGTVWKSNATAHNPGTRYRAPLVFDAHRNVLVLYGGTTNYDVSTAVSATWEYDGKDWTKAPDTTGPGQRFRHSAAFDRLRNRLVVFGGTNAAGVDLQDTWEYDGSGWTQVATTGPSARRWAAMAFDAAIGKTVLFGGANGNTALNDTWTWDGTQWHRLTTNPTPLPRLAPGFAYDPHQARITMYAGQASAAGTGARDDVWIFDGAKWTELDTSPAIAKEGVGFAYDTERHVFVLAGGSSTSDLKFTTAQTWEATTPCTSAPSISEQPNSVSVCRSGSGAFAVDSLVGGGGPYSYQWQIMTSPGVWTDLIDATLPLPCGGSATALGSSTSAMAVGIIPCVDVNAYSVRCFVTNACGSTASTAASLTICGADFDCSGFVDTDDFTGFVQAFEAGTDDADFDGSGFVDTDDFTAFVNAFEAGC